MTLIEAPVRHRAAPSLPRLRPRPLLAAIGAGGIAVPALWWWNTTSVAGLGGWLTAAGRICGLLGGYGIAVLLALMARVPALERGVGTDRLTRWHARGGRYTVWLLIAHTLLIIWGYAVTENTGVVDETVTMVLTFPDVLKATVALFLLVGVGLISIRAARRRLRYETWFHLHFYTYLAAWLAFGHQIATGAEFVGRRWVQALWLALYLGVAGLLVWYRFLGPVIFSVRHRLRVERVVPEAPGVVSVHVSGRGLHRMRDEPGQFFRWRFLTRELWWSANPYSLSAPAQPDMLRITVKALGDHSAALASLRPGTRVIAEGPYGAFTAGLRRRGRTLLIAGGVGITPLRTLFETLSGEVTLLYRARTPQDLVFREELEEIAARRGAQLRYSVGSRAEVGQPFTAATLRDLVPELAEHDVYLCGPPEMTAAARSALREAGVPARQIHHESFEF
ncbi:ferredoxin reductase family protein [Acrocarpospora catenulata]|uniref:ferredoxin reductase family protein n=1 Tax=Acrocarpospora catenulata TaxID=2836182 RepID=UPI001BDA6045|nr:ferredoxin reductase family protein [Acrocarpospora catenulata]